MTTRLTAGQAARYAEWIVNQRELRRLIAEMEQISRQEAFRMIHCSSSPKTTGVARRIRTACTVTEPVSMHGPICDCQITEGLP